MRPPPAIALEFSTLPAGSEITRVHHLRFSPVEFDTPRALPHGEPVVPMLYAALDSETALVEALFHDVPLTGTRRLARAALFNRFVSRLVAERDLRLLTIRDRELIEAPASAYRWTEDWAAALHAMAPQADGMIWMGRRLADRPALVLFGDRIDASELTATGGPEPVWHGPGLERVERAAMRADVTLLL